MEQKSVEIYPRIVYSHGSELRLNRAAQKELSLVRPYICLADMNMDGEDEVIKLSEGQALQMLERLAGFVRRNVAEKAL